MMRYLTELFLSLPDAHHLRGVSDVDRGRSPGQVIRLPVHILETFTIKHHDKSLLRLLLIIVLFVRRFV